MSFQTLLFRLMCSRSDKKRDKGLTDPPEVAHNDNICYGTDRKWQILDVYRPKNAEGKLPVLVSFHGGGWVYGTKEIYRYYCMELAKQGFAVVNFTYRLAPGNRFPAGLEDLSAVFAFVLRHAAEYGFDTGKIFGIGDSSGAMGMAIYACALTNPAFAAQFPVRMPEGLVLRGLGLNFGMFDTEGMREVLRDLLPKGREEETLRLLSSHSHAAKQFPPSFLMSAEGDFNKEPTLAFGKVLEQLGVHCCTKIYGDAQNPLGHVFHCNVRSADGRQANRDELDFFRSLKDTINGDIRHERGKNDDFM